MHYDYHTHTSFSDDCYVTMEDMIRGAIAAGVKEMAITDHYDPGYPDPEFPFIIEFDSYYKNLSKLSEKYKEQITVKKGLEVGIMEGQFEAASNVVKSKAFDFIIGSFHCYKEFDLCTFDYDSVDGPKLLMNFYEHVYNCLQKYDDYDIIGHFSIIDRYIGHIYDYKNCMDIIEACLKTIIEKEKGIEINTSSFKYKMGLWLPRKEILQLYKDLGGEILTMGSDSHEPRHFLDHFDEAVTLAKEVGFKYYCTFENRKPKFLPL